MTLPVRKVDARLSGRHPFEVFVLYLSLAVSIPTVFGAAPRPGSIAESMPDWAGYLWAIVLLVGSVAALAGIYWKERATGLILEQLGLAFVGVVCVIYGVVAAASLGLAILVPAGIIVGYGAACLWRWHQIQDILNDVAKLETKLEIEKKRGF